MNNVESMHSTEMWSNNDIMQRVSDSNNGYLNSLIIKPSYFEEEEEEDIDIDIDIESKLDIPFMAKPTFHSSQSRHFEKAQKEDIEIEIEPKREQKMRKNKKHQIKEHIASFLTKSELSEINEYEKIGAT